MTSNKPTSYVDTLSDDILAKLMRYMDCDSDYALFSLLFDENSPFVSASQQVFITIRLVSDGTMFCNVEGGFIQLNCGSDEIEVASRVLQVCGGSVEIIELKSVIRHEVEHYAALLLKYCTGVKEVRVRGADGCVRFRTAVSNIVEAFSTRLETLQFLEYRRRRVFSSRVAARLGGGCKRLSSFTYRGNELHRLSHLWRGIGEHLKEINLRSIDNTEWSLVFENLNFHCRALKCINLHQPLMDDNVDDEMMARFFASYGEQLERASLPSLNEHSCSIIANSCRNLRCSFLEYDHEFGRIAALGERIEKLGLTLQGSRDWTPLSDAMKYCSGLVTLEVGASFRNPLEVEAWVNLFSSNLMYLECLILPTISRNTEVLETIAKNTRRLRTICIAFESIEDGTVFELLGRANNCLEDVTLSEMEPHPDRTTSEKVIKVMKDTFDCFHRCKTMNRFSLELKSNAPDFGLLRNLFVRQRIQPAHLRFEFLGSEWSQSCS